MSKHTDTLRKRWQDAEAKAQKLQADKDDALAKTRDRYSEKLRAAADDAAAAQKEWLDALAGDSLLDRPDGEQIARSLGLET